jgi:hypothetical protein
MKFWTRLLLLAVFDFAIIWFWVKQQDPDPSVAIGIIVLVPIVIVLNFIIAWILFATKRQYAKLFIVNSFISAALMYLLFNQGISRHQRQRYEIWEFHLNDTAYSISHYKPDTTFSISYSTNPGSSSSYVYGHVEFASDQYTLFNDTLRLKIKNEYLFGFRNNIDSIKLKRLDL